MTGPRIPNLFAVPELKEKILFTLLCLAVYRAGAHIATPGVNVAALQTFMNTQGRQTLFGVYDLFVGGGLSRATVLALGIMPYISSSIVIQLLGAVVPYFQKLQKEGEDGRKKITQYTRYGTVLICLLQASGVVVKLESTVAPGGPIVPVQVQGGQAAELRQAERAAVQAAVSSSRRPEKRAQRTAGPIGMERFFSRTCTSYRKDVD